MPLISDWVDFPNGRARFAEGIRGADERGHETFAVDLDGRVFYGEVRRRFSGNVMFLEISNFGYEVENDVGIPGAADAFSPSEALRVQDLVRRLVVTVDGYAHDDKPISMRTLDGTVFPGDIVFLDGWIVISNG